MGFLGYVQLALGSIQLLLQNPLLGGQSNVRHQEAAELIGILSALIEEGEDAYEDLKAFAEEVKTMAEEGRSPTPQEWAVLRARKDAAHDRLQQVKENILNANAEEAQPAPETEEEEAPLSEATSRPSDGGPEVVN